ncbi:MAG: ankyrin repeat domain-containing protein [Cocleimonas sp.]
MFRNLIARLHLWIFIILVAHSSHVLADSKAESVMFKSCLKSYNGAYQSHKKHKAFSYARDDEGGKDRCGWNYGSDSAENAEESALKQCAKVAINAECKILDIDGKWVAKDDDFSAIVQPDNKPLNKEQQQKLMDTAKAVLMGNCLPFFKEHLKAKGYKVYSYAIDDNGDYACGRSYKNNSLKVAIKSAIKSCGDNKKKRAKKAPKNKCLTYAHGNKIVMKADDFGVIFSPKRDKKLSDSEYKKKLQQAEEILQKSCFFQFKYYLRSKQHNAFYLARDEKGNLNCGRSEDQFSLKIAKSDAEKKCKEAVKKSKLDASCKVYAENYDIVASNEDFGIKSSKEDFIQAIFKGNLAKIKKYIAKGEDPNTASPKDGITSIFIAAAKGDEAFFLELVKKGADIHAHAKDGSNLLVGAVFGENINIVRYLLDKDLDVNHKSSGGNTPLHIASRKLNSYLLGVLIRAGADYTIANDLGKTVESEEKKWKTDLSLMKKIDINAKDSEGWTALHLAAVKGDREGVKKLIKMKSDVNIRASHGNTPLYDTGDAKVAEILLAAGAKIDAVDDYGETALMAAAQYSDPKKAIALMSHGANKTLKNKKGKSAYDFAEDDEMRKIIGK